MKHYTRDLWNFSVRVCRFEKRIHERLNEIGYYSSSGTYLLEANTKQVHAHREMTAKPLHRTPKRRHLVCSVRADELYRYVQKGNYL